MKYVFSIAIISVLLLSGCNDNHERIRSNEDTAQVQKVKERLEQSKQVNKAVIVSLGTELFVAIEVKPLQSFKERKIASDLQQEWSNEWGEEDVTVSSDFKLYWELSKLLEEKDQEKVSEELKQLKVLKKEET